MIKLETMYRARAPSKHIGVVKWNLFGNLHHHQDDDQVTSIDRSVEHRETARKSDSKRNTYACGETF